MKKLITIFITIIIVMSGCDSARKEKNKVLEKNKILEKKDFEDIKKDGKLKVLVVYSSTSYFLYKGQPMGYEYELLKRLADHLQLDLQLEISRDINTVLDDLNSGKVDLVAHGLTITSDRKEIVNFTDYLFLTKQVLIQKKPNNWRKMSWSKIQKNIIHDPIELIGDTVSVRENSSYSHRLKNLSTEIGGKIIIDPLDGEMSTEEIIKMVVDGKIKHTVADNNLASINASYYPILNIDVPISFSQRIAWAVRKESPELLNVINQWIKKERDIVDYYVIYNKYFKNKRDFKRRTKSNFNSLNSNQISEYDKIIKIHAKKLGWDWRLVTSLIYQESRFKPNSKSWAGAKGLMQIMPATAKELGVKNPNNAEESIQGGTKYLKSLYEKFTEIEDSVERIKFTMAAYNCGYYHIKDAQRLTEENDLDNKIWDNNVEKMVLTLSNPSVYNKSIINYGYVRGIEPVTYVEQIFERYSHYSQFIEK
jgi:membrane-bound lytic murein transglycosylase F